MSKNKIIILIFISIVLLIALILAFQKKNNTLELNNDTEVEHKEKLDSLYDEETGLYYIKDEETRRDYSCEL